MAGESYSMSDRTGWRLIYSDSSSFTNHVQVITCNSGQKEEDNEF